MMCRKVCWFILVGLFTVLPARAGDDATPVRYDNYKAVRVFIGAPEQIEQVHAVGARLMSEAEGIGPVEYLVAPEDMPALQQLGLPLQVLNDNVQAAIDAERQSMAATGEVSPLDPAWFENYKTYEQVNDKLNQMAADRPDLASVFDVGFSFENRHIYGIRITGPGAAKPAVMFNGCHHAREWISVMVPVWIADQLVYDYDTDPRIHAAVDSLEFFVIPVVNVDGFVYTQTDRMWRKNRRPPPSGYSCYGVDLNRNYATGWSTPGGSSTYPCDETYRGTAPFSEPEAAAMRDFTIAHPQIVATQSYHSYHELVMSPYGYTSSLPPDNAIFLELDQGQHDAILAVHGLSYGYGPIYSTIYPCSGCDVDWYYADQGIFSFTTELRDTGQYGFLLPADQIIPTCEENFAAALYLSEWFTSPVKISFPDGLPARLTPAEPEDVTVSIIAVGAELDTTSPRLYSRVGASGPFVESTLAPLGDDLYQATLPATPCGATREYYFSASTTMGAEGVSPLGAPDTTYAATAAPITIVLDATMDSNPGWTVSGGQWAWGDPTGSAGDPDVGHTGNNVYGYNLNGAYTNNMPEYHLTTPAFDCTGLTGTTLSFWRWLGVESSRWDHAYVRVSNDGSTWTDVWQNPPSTLIDTSWVYQEFDISAIADNHPNVYLRWTMGTTDTSLTYCGWNIDDVQVCGSDPDGCPPGLGDVNCDGVLNAFDIDPFVLALTDEAGYAAEFPSCDRMLADVNGDGQVNAFDIDPFVILLTSGG
jgi:murein tripeptide amidase MpaA